MLVLRRIQSSHVLLLSSSHSVANIRNHLAAAVPSNDQILLLGPPYKVPKDNTLQSLEIISSLRLGDKEDEEAMNNGGGGGGLGNESSSASSKSSLRRG